MRALVADRSATTRRVVIRALRTTGISDTLEFADYSGAADALESDPDVVVVGWDTADDTGLALVAKLRARDGGTRACVVVLTERDGREDVERALGLGVQGYVLKPVEARVLAEQLTAAMSAATNAPSEEQAEAA